MYNILIGIICGGTVRAETMTSTIGAMDLLKEKGIPVWLDIQIGGYAAHNRNNLVKTAREKGASHLMFIDNDMTFPPSGILRLLDHDKDIVAANYNARGVPGKPSISVMKLGDDFTSGETKSFQIGPELLKCSATGTGFMLIKTSVFDKLDPPWFVAWENEKGDHHTEDVEFCKNAREAGFDVWISPTIKMGHIGTAVY